MWKPRRNLQSMYTKTIIWNERHESISTWWWHQFDILYHPWGNPRHWVYIIVFEASDQGSLANATNLLSLSASSLYLGECWPRSMSPCGVTKPHWVKVYCPVVDRECALHEIWTHIPHVIMVSCWSILLISFTCISPGNRIEPVPVK